ncbi:MAG: hypothetical protein H0X24_09425 [Ktedonobacterales bacterium]|nr:hypothetical protein [Ktedonobacterales bacterium]
MGKTDVLARLQGAVDALAATLRRIGPNQWNRAITRGGRDAHDLLNYAMNLLELSGNAYLQSLQVGAPAMTPSQIDALARLNAERRRGRLIATDFDDYLASARSLIILIDMASEDIMTGTVWDMSREQWFMRLADTLDAINHLLTAWFAQQPPP